jgi:hypothetical protein
LIKNAGDTLNVPGVLFFAVVGVVTNKELMPLFPAVIGVVR